MNRAVHTWSCPRCGTFAFAEQRFCRKCGTQRPVAAPFSVEATPPRRTLGRPRPEAISALLVVVVAMIFAVLGGLVALIVNDVSDGPSDPTVPSLTAPPTSTTG